MSQRDTPFDDPKARFQAGLFGMWLFLVVLAIVFISTIIGYLVVRIDNGAAFIPENAPKPPLLLLVSTGVLLLSSVTMQKALRAGREGDADLLPRLCLRCPGLPPCDPPQQHPGV